MFDILPAGHLARRHMTLAEYLDRHKLSQNEFGRRIGAAGGTVSRWTTGRRRPTLELMMKIERATGGWVTAKEFFWRPALEHELAEIPEHVGRDHA